MKCKHEIKYRQAIAGGIDSFSTCPYAIICLRCGEILVSGKLNKGNKLNVINLK